MLDLCFQSCSAIHRNVVPLFGGAAHLKAQGSTRQNRRWFTRTKQEHSTCLHQRLLLAAGRLVIAIRLETLEQFDRQVGFVPGIDLVEALNSTPSRASLPS